MRARGAGWTDFISAGFFKIPRCVMEATQFRTFARPGFICGSRAGYSGFSCEWPLVGQCGPCDQSGGLQRCDPDLVELLPGEERSASAGSRVVYVAPLGARSFRYSESGAG